MKSAEFFQDLCPWLHVNGALRGKELGREVSLPTLESSLRDHLQHHGFIKLNFATLWSGGTDQDGAPAASEAPVWVTRLTSRLARGIHALAEAGLAASYILAYDEAWLLQALIAGLLGRVTGGNAPIFDWYIFNVSAHGTGSAGGPRGADAGEKAQDESSPSSSSSSATSAKGGKGVAPKGWPPHRDRPLPDEASVQASLREDGTAKYTTVWIPLTDATPESSCLYCVPAQYDPGYLGGDPAGVQPLDGVIRTPADYQKIIAMPVPAGSLLAFTHRLLHWGSAPLQPVPGQAPPPPRMAMSLAFADPTFEPPYFAQPEALGAFPPHEARMGLVSAQALAYAHQAPLSGVQAARHLETFKATRHHFSDGYAARVMKAGQWVAFTGALAGAGDSDEDEEVEEEEGQDSTESEGASGQDAHDRPQARPKPKAASGFNRLLSGHGAPSAEAVNLMFAAYARAQEGMDAVAYL